MNKYIIETNNLCKKSGSIYRVKDLNLQIPEGLVFGFLGPNGAGKTTTLKMLLGLIKPTGGNIKFSVENRAKNIGSLIETPGGYGHLTGLENMQIIQKLKGASENDVVKALHTVRLYDAKDKKLKSYSLGMRQRLGIAMALLGDPKILILDEPTNGLDPAGILEIRTLIRNLSVEKGISVIVSSHILSEIEQTADYIGIIDHGRMLYQGKLSNLETNGKSLEDIFLQMTNGGASL